MTRNRFWQSLNWQMVHARGLNDVERCLGQIQALVGNAKNRPVRVLEIDCRFAQSLLELRGKFGEDVELHGLNRHPLDGDAAVAIHMATFRNILDAADSRKADLVDIRIGSLDAPLPYPDDYFDVVYSVMGVIYAREKAQLVEEVHRVLRPGGTARLLPAIERKDPSRGGGLIQRPELPAEYRQSWVMESGGQAVDSREFLRRFPQIVLADNGDHEVMRITKGDGLRLHLRLVDSEDLHVVDPGWFGAKSVFTIEQH